MVLPHRERFGPETAGAVARVVHGLAASSRRPVQVFGPPFAGAPYPGIAFHTVAAPRLLPLSQTQRYLLGLLPALRRARPAAVEVHNKPDVASALARLLPCPVSLFLHNDPRSMRGASSAAARARLLRRLAAVVTVSDHLRRRFLEGVAAPAAPVHVLHNTIDPALLPPPLPPGQRDQVILFAGRVVADKGADAFVAACAAALPDLPGWRAEIIGGDGFTPGEPDTPFIRALRPRAEAAGVRLLGFQPHAAVLRALSRAAIAAVPSRWEEPFGLAALEAMACGAALLCSGRGGLAEIAGDTCLPCDPDDAAGFAAGMIRLARDPALRAELAQRARTRAVAAFSPGDAAERLEALRHEIGRQGRR